MLTPPNLNEVFWGVLGDIDKGVTGLTRLSAEGRY